MSDSMINYTEYLTEMLDLQIEKSYEDRLQRDRETVMEILEKNPNLLQEVILELRNRKIEQIKKNIE